MYHQTVVKFALASAIIWPQLAVGGFTPTPRNDSAGLEQDVLSGSAGWRRR